MRRHGAAGEHRPIAAAALDDHAVRRRRAAHPERAQAIGHHRDSVGFLYAKFLGAGDHRAPLGAGGGDEQHRELVDRQRHQGRWHLDATQRGRANPQVTDRFAAHLARILHGQIGAHQPQDVQDAGAGRVQPDVTQQQVGARRDRGADDEERGRRDVGRHVDRGGPQRLTATQPHRRAVAFDGDAEAPKHPLGVVAARSRLDDRGHAVGIQARQQHRRLDLGTGHRHPVVDRGEPARRPDAHRRRAALSGRYPGAHPRQRLGHPAHRAPAQAFVTDQHRLERLAGQQAHQQPHRGARIAAVELAARRAQSVPPDSVHDHPPVLRAFDPHAQRPEHVHRRDRVGALQKAADPRRAVGDRAKHDRAVRNRLVPGHPQRAGQTSARAHPECGKHEFFPVRSDCRRAVFGSLQTSHSTDQGWPAARSMPDAR